MSCKASWKFIVITMFPQSFPGALGASVIGRALFKKIWDLEIIDLHHYASKARVDDAPYGGGAGMIIKPDVLADAIDDATKRYNFDEIIYLTPRGQVFNQKTAFKYTKLQNICIICGRFEGIDQRVLEFYSIKELSIGDYVLAGGEVAAMVIIEAIVRLLPGVIQNSTSLESETFADGLLEYNQYTRPPVWRGLEVPLILRGGNHQQIQKWRQQNSLSITKKIRPDLYEKKVE